jgi:predicted transport protein
MALSVRGEQVELVLRKMLPRQGYKLLNNPRTQGETGADIIAQKGRVRVFIECIGFQKVAPLRSKQFYEVFFRAISRLKGGARKCVMALPIRFENGMNQRAEHYGEAWKRIGNAFPELEVWFVDVENDVYEERKWNDWPTTPFDNISSGDAASQYTEDSHLKNYNEKARDIYKKIKKSFLKIKGTIKFNPVKSYIGVVDRKRIAYIQPKGKKVHLIVLMAEDEVKEVLRLKHHEVVSFSESRQRTWGGKNPSCAVNIYDTDHWDEIQKLVTRLVEKHEET